MKKDQNLAILLNTVAETVSVGDDTVLKGDAVLSLKKGEKIKRLSDQHILDSERGERVLEF